MKFKNITVVTYNGYKSPERPLSFTCEGKLFNITEIIDRWYEGDRLPGKPYLDYFKVKTDDGNTYILRYNGLFDSWALVEHKSSDCSKTHNHDTSK